MQPINSKYCPSCGTPLQPADFFDQKAGFPHADCACGYRTKPAKDAHALSAISMSKDFAAGQALWLDAKAKVSKFGMVESARSLCDSAALLLRIAAADASPEARIAERWLGNMGLVAGLTRLSMRASIDGKGEGPRSGGGVATSGAGAQRKEGVQPPGDSDSVIGARA